MRTHSLATCPGCGDPASEPVELDSEHELRRCSTCSLVYASTYADPSEIYVDGYLDGATDFGIDVHDPHFQRYLEFAATKRLEVLEALRPQRGSFLDVGCGTGEVLAVAHRRGWTVGGAEPVEASAATARSRGIDVRTAMLEDAGFEEGAWDVVSAFHVLEHMTDGVAFLQLLTRWARPGGLVVIEVPNWGSRDRERLGARWPMLRPLEHIAHYDVGTLEQTFRRAGLEPVSVRSKGFLWPDQTLDQQLADLAHGRWRPLLTPFCRSERQGDRSVLIPRRSAHRALLATQAWHARLGRGQVVLGAARVPG